MVSIPPIHTPPPAQSLALPQVGPAPGRYKQDGRTCSKVGDVDEFSKFRSEVAGAFIVGDTVLESEEVTIGEPYNPSLCDISAN